MNLKKICNMQKKIVELNLYKVISLQPDGANFKLWLLDLEEIFLWNMKNEDYENIVKEIFSFS